MTFAEEKSTPAAPQPPRGREGERKDNITRLGGTIAAVTGNSLTLTVVGREGQPGREETVALNPDTKVRVATDQMEEVAGEGGKMQQRPKMVDGAIADLKVGQRVYVRAKDGVATEIVVPRTPAKREGGGGERKEVAPAPQPRRGEGERER
jgi:hypothetical protein